MTLDELIVKLATARGAGISGDTPVLVDATGSDFSITNVVGLKEGDTHTLWVETKAAH